MYIYIYYIYIRTTCNIYTASEKPVDQGKHAYRLITPAKKLYWMSAIAAHWPKLVDKSQKLFCHVLPIAIPLPIPNLPSLLETVWWISVTWRMHEEEKIKDQANQANEAAIAIIKSYDFNRFNLLSGFDSAWWIPAPMMAHPCGQETLRLGLGCCDVKGLVYGEAKSSAANPASCSSILLQLVS